ncbi:hypothetical protein AX16_000079 [Volvariella volvacea WC 439]|nr:hypothetical protein AX16_000079 [Volvariella volvacea WC 439]
MASDESQIEKLINQCRHNDVDVKVDALTKLQAEFEQGVEIVDADSLITVLKACLRTPNQLLTTATLSALPPLFPLILTRPYNPQSFAGPPPSASSSTSSIPPQSSVDIVALRQVFNAFLPSGGLIDRLGDKERAQAKAKESLVILGGLAFRAGSPSNLLAKSRDGKSSETPLMTFERHLRELGLSSKVWKVREQSILTLVQIRRAHHQFPIRPYLLLLVECLEDPDPHVRDCARQSVIELFTGPGVTDVARADLKEKMTKKGVRKTIMDSILSKLLGSSQSREGSDNGEAAVKVKEYIPPSLMLQGKRSTSAAPSAVPTPAPRSLSQSVTKELKDVVPSRPSSRAAMISPPPATPTSDNADVQPVYVASPRDLENEFAAMSQSFQGKETEHNWADRDRAVSRVRGMLKGDIQQRYPDAFLAALKDGFIQWSLKTLASLRTTVATNTCSLYSELAIAFGSAIDPFCETLLTNLLKMAGFTKKITAQQSQASVSIILAHTSPQPRIVLPLLWNLLQEKTVQTRAAMVAHLKLYLETHATRAKHVIEGAGGVDIIEKALKRALADPNPAVRESSRALFWIFEEVWRDRGSAIMETLDASARKQLERACPNPNLASDIPSAPKTVKKSSVAAAIAASRAKAKAIATAPPTLRHQATSAAANVPRRALSPTAVSPPRFNPSNSTSARPGSPLGVSSTTSPPAKRPRLAGTMSRSTSSSVPKGLSLHSRTSSGGSGASTSPPSPTDQAVSRRRTSSPLASPLGSAGNAMLRKAMQTALPASPPSTSHTPLDHSFGGVRPITSLMGARQSILLPQMFGADESLLMAQSIPIPNSDSESEDENLSVNLMSFSTPFAKYPPPPPPPKSTSQARSISPKSIESKPTQAFSNALSSDSVLDITAGAPVVEDALRARAEQAESAAERLLELVEPDDDNLQHPTLPPSLMVGSKRAAPPTQNTVTRAKTKPTPIPIVQQQKLALVTPVSQKSSFLRQTAMYQDSPAFGGKPAPSLLDALQGRKDQSSWWLKRKSLLEQGMAANRPSSSNKESELKIYIEQLSREEVDVQVLKQLALLSVENPTAENGTPPMSPDFSSYPLSPSPFIGSSRSIPSLHSEMWEKDKNFEKLFNALLQYLDPTKTEEQIEYGLILLWELLENQGPYLEGREADLFSILLRVRYCNKVNVLEATSAIRDALIKRIAPVYGLTTMHASLKTFLNEDLPEISNEEVKFSTYAFGLMALGKFIMRLPAEIAEEELPRLKNTLISALNNRASLIVRESAASAIIAAQLVLQDETHLFTLLDGLADDKKNLLTYLFDKHGARGTGPTGGPITTPSLAKEKLEKELRRLDTRTSTPLRPRT